MITGSLCFTEILKSPKPCSSNSEASHTADSTSASGVALPCLASSRGSSEPALTPRRMGVPRASPGARAAGRGRGVAGRGGRRRVGRAGVDADADGGAPVLRGCGDLLDLVVEL